MLLVKDASSLLNSLITLNVSSSFCIGLEPEFGISAALVLSCEIVLLAEFASDVGENLLGLFKALILFANSLL